MSSLYNLQAALKNTASADSAALRNAFSHLRQRLKVHWEDFLNYLKRCYAFGADVLLLTQALGTESREDCLEFLTDMKASAEELLTITHQLYRNSEGVVAGFAKDKANFAKALQS